MKDLVLRLCGLGVESQRSLRQITQSVHKWQIRLNYQIETYENEDLETELRQFEV